MYRPKNLERWRLPKYYAGAHWPEYYSAGVGRSRDSDCGEESNFDAMLGLLGGESPTVRIVREGHFLCGWVEWIAIYHLDEKALRAADAAVARLEDYPVLDEDDYCQREWDECERVWSDCYRERDRIKYLREHAHYPAETFGQLRAAVAGDWSEASRLLNSPTDIIY
jgi:hypothetical protein